MKSGQDRMVLLLWLCERTNERILEAVKEILERVLCTRLDGKFTVSANFPYLYPHPPPIPSNKLGGMWGIGG